VKTAVSRLGGLARGAAIEATWLAAHIATYPLGVLQEKSAPGLDRFSLQGLPPVQRGLFVGDVEAAGTPILLVHGMVDNRSIFTVLRRALRRRGFGRVWTMNYHVLTHDLRAASKRLAATVEAVCAQTGYERIHVIGHSMGGIIARYYVQRMGGDQRVHTLVTLGSPHGGTRAARLLPRGVCRQLRPSSDVIAELGAPVESCRTRFLCFWSDLDVLISPKPAARIDHPDLNARNVFVRGVGHMSLPIDGRVTREIANTLAQLDSDGMTVRSGVTHLDHSPARGTARPGPGRRSATAG